MSPLTNGHHLQARGTGPNEIRSVELRPQDPTTFHIKPLLSDPDLVVVNESPHRHNFQELIWIKSGSGRHIIDGQVLEIKPYTFYLIAKGQVHQFIEGYNIKGYLIRFTDDFLPNALSSQAWDFHLILFSNISLNHTLPVNQEDAKDLDLLLQQMMQEYDCQGEFGKYEVLRHLFGVLLVKLECTRRRLKLSEGKLGETDYRDGVFQDFVTLLDARYQTCHHVSQYAAALNLAPRQLSDTVKHFLGKTAKQIIQERLVLEAKRYLRYTNLSVKEIAFALGYKDPSYFSKVFKRLTGDAPQAYR